MTSLSPFLNIPSKSQVVHQRRWSALPARHPLWSMRGKQYSRDNLSLRSFLPEEIGVLTTCDVQYGFIVRKKVGCAVVRNKIKRRLRAVLWRLSQEVFRSETQCVPSFFILFVKDQSVAVESFDVLCGKIRELLAQAWRRSGAGLVHLS